MKATIVATNKRKGLYAFFCDGDYGYFELLGGEDINVEDVLVGDFSSLGSTTVKILDSKEIIDIFIEDFCSFEFAIERISKD